MCERMKCFDSIVYFHYVMITCLKAEANLDITYEENLFCKEFQCFASSAGSGTRLPENPTRK